MHAQLIIGSLLAAGLSLALAGRRGDAQARDYPIRPVPFTQVRVADAFWSPRLETNRQVTIPYAFKMCEETGRIDNFAVAGRLKEGKFRGIYFNDSDVYKVIEGAAYSLHLYPDPALDKYVDDVIAKIAAAQEKDGYLYTARTLMTPDKMPPGGKERWSDMAGGHELYCVGHMYEAAVAHFQATGKRTLLDVATKNADLVCSVFGPGRRGDPCGHPEVEIGLMKLYRTTGDAKYLEMAKFFLDAHGRTLGGRKLYGTYAQDHKPLVEQTEAVGHAVRAGYVYSGMADVAALTGDAAYLQAIDRLWENVVSTKLYVTGGIGARGGGEAFGEDYELPNSSAYCETCAAIANALWNHRLFLLHGDSRYLDVLERVIYNGFLSGVAMEGNRFFSPNPLESHRGQRRSPWFDCACCPSNVVRFVPSIPGYAYAVAGDRLYVNLFIGGSATVKMGDRTVQVKQETRYPWDGAVKITVDPPAAGKFAVYVRIPGWARNQVVPSDLYRYTDKSDAAAKIMVNGQAVALDIEKGFARLDREWKKGDVIELDLPMPVRRVVAHAKVADDAGRVALERGPIVFCAEGPDNKDGRVLNLMVPDQAALRSEFRKDLLGGVQVVLGKAVAVVRKEDGTPVAGEEQDFLAIPNYAWAHRQPSQMAVWLAREVKAAKPLPGPTIAFTSKVTVSSGAGIEALNDQLEPRSSIDHSNPYFHWWPHKGTKEWVQYDFRRPEKVAAVDVYWFDDTGIGECRLPRSWSLKAKVKGEWRNVPNPGGYGVMKDVYNRTTFDPIEAEGLRLEVQLQDKWAAGIHEWRVFAPGDRPAAGDKPAAPEKAAARDAAARPAADEKPPRIAIDAAKTGEPISKYVYGQFIEHLGRCIYGGIWAEMLEDRKFYFPITPKYAPYKAAKDVPLPVVAASPWQVVGDEGGVKMVKEEPFVGEHTPEVAPSSGIRQNDLGLVKGRAYVGYVWLKAAKEAADVEVAVRWGDGQEDMYKSSIKAGGKGYEKHDFRFTSGADSAKGSLEIRVTGGGPCRVGTASLMPADNTSGMRADTLELLKQLDSPVYRWPGGNFVSGYNWKDGLGDRDRRPPRKNPAWTGVEHNDFGLDEFMTFCRVLGTDPYIAVNSGLGDAKNAVEELQYANGAADTPMGALRAKNGHPEPYKVRFWSIGNEMYGGWQLGHMPLEQYVKKHNEFVDAMRAVDPSIQVIAVGNAGKWSEGMMQNCAGHMSYLSEHFYCGEKPTLPAHAAQIPNAIRGKAEAHRRYRREIEALKGKDIRIAMDEWNYWYGPHPFGELGTRYFLKDALGIAAGLNEYARQSDIVFMANYAQTVNVIGCLKTSKTAAALETTGLVLKLYRAKFGVLPAATETEGLVNAQAAWSEDRKTLTLSVVNPSTAALEILLEVKGAKLAGTGTRWQIAGDDPKAYNDPGQPPKVAIEEAAVKGVSDKLSVAPCSVTLFALKVE